MKVSVDLDGTLYAHKAFFRELFRAFGSPGHSIGILTGHPAESEASDLAALAALGFSVDFYLGRTADYIPLNGMHFKLAVIAAHGIDLHFDDLDYEHPETMRLWREAPEELRQRIVVMPHKGNGVRSE